MNKCLDEKWAKIKHFQILISRQNRGKKSGAGSPSPDMKCWLRWGGVELRVSWPPVMLWMVPCEKTAGGLLDQMGTLSLPCLSPPPWLDPTLCWMGSTASVGDSNSSSSSRAHSPSALIRSGAVICLVWIRCSGSLAVSSPSLAPARW